MKKMTKLIGLALCGLFGVALGVGSLEQIKPAFADEPPTPAIAANMTMADLQYFGGNGCSWDGTDNSVSLASGQSFEYRAPNNYVLDTTITFPADTPWYSYSYFYLRATDGDSNPATALSNTGYCIGWRASGGDHLFYKSGTSTTPEVCSLPAYMWGGTFHVVFSAIDMSDGSVVISITVNDTECFRFVDEAEVVNGDIFSGFCDGASLSIAGASEDVPIVELSGLSTPVSTHPWYGPSSIEDNGTVHFASTGSSGVYYSFYSFSKASYGYEMNLKSVTTAANVYFTIGGSDFWYAPMAGIAADRGQEQDDKYGYVIGWYRGGNGGTFGLRKSSDLSTIIVSGYSAVNPAADQECLFQVTHKDFEDGSSKITVRCDGVIRLAYLDIKTSENTPISPVTGRSYVGVYTEWCNVDLLPTHTAPTVRNISIDELGPITFNQSGESVIDRNGNLTGLQGALRYENAYKNSIYQFDVRFTALGSGLPAFELFLNYSGEPDTPWGGDWTQKAYCFRMYCNGMYNLFCKGTSLYEGWGIGPGSFPFTTDTDYHIKVGSWSVGDDSSVVALYVNDSLVVSYVDFVNDVNEAGQFALRTEGCTANLTLSGYSPVVLNVPETASEGQEIDLSYENPQVGDVVTYYIDDNSTAEGTIVGNKLTVGNKMGTLNVYAKVNGFYSANYSITVHGATFTSIPSEFVYGSGSLAVTAAYSDGRELSSIVYSIEEGNDIASINNEGLITLTGIGKIRVKAVLTDTDSNVSSTADDEGFIVIKPANPTFATDPMEVGEEQLLSASINAPIPSGDGFTYSIVEGAENASIDGATITGVKAGEVTVRATFASGKDYSVYTDSTFVVYGAKMSQLPANPIIVGNDDDQLHAQYTTGVDGTVVKYYVDDATTNPELTGKATVNEDTGVIHYISAGTVQVYATVDDLNTAKTTLVLNPRVDIEKANSMAVGAERELGYRVNCDLPDETVVATYQIVSGENLVTDFNPTTGHIKATGIGVMTVRVSIAGETFSGSSIDTQIAIENPIVVVTTPVKDMITGNIQVIEATLGNEEIKTENKSISVTSGADCVSVDGMTISAVAPGTVTFKVIINGFEGVSNTIDITALSVTINAGDMYLNDNQQLSYVINDPNYVATSVVYSVVSGEDIVSIEGTTLKSGEKSGQAVIKVVVDNKIENTVTVNVRSAISLSGLVENQEYTVGSVLELGYINNTEQELANISYELVMGQATIENLPDNKGKLTINGTGKIVVVVKSGDITSLPVTIYGKGETPAPGSDYNVEINEEQAKEGINVTAQFNTAKEYQQTVSIKIEKFNFAFNSAAVGEIAGKEIVFKFDDSVDTSVVEGSKLVFDVTLAGATFENGKVTVSFDFVNEAADNQEAKVFYIDGNGNRTDMNAVFENGKVSFETNHFSRYAIVYVDVEPAPQPANSGLSTGAIVGIVLGSVAVAALIGVGVFFLLKKKRAK